MKWLAKLTLSIAMSACGFAPEHVTFADPRVTQLLAAMDAADRASLGFSVIDPSSDLRLEWCPSAGYDARLHVNGRTRRTIAFRPRPGSCERIGEQEILAGPGEYETPDGPVHESITITFERAPISGVPVDELDIQYRGADERRWDLDRGRGRTLEVTRRLLAEWGFGSWPSTFSAGSPAA